MLSLPSRRSPSWSLSKRKVSLLAAFLLVGSALTNGCRQSTPAEAEVPDGEPEDVSPATSEVMVSNDTVAVGDTAILALQARDADGQPIAVSGLTVEFRIEGGTSDGAISLTREVGQGRYEAGFRAESPGSPASVRAWINGMPVTSQRPTITVMEDPSPPQPGDRDGDGVADAEDDCPDDPGPASNNGCPEDPPPPPADSDGDGVPDDQDSCPSEPGPASNAGCPEEAPPPPPPPGDCDLIVNAADGPPNAAVNTAQPGQRVCLAGSFTLDHVFRAQGTRDGVDAVLVDVSVSDVVLDGSGATVSGDFAQADNTSIVVSAANVAVVGFTIDVGYIIVGPDADNARVANNTIRRPVFPNGNAGAVRSLGGENGFGPAGVVVEDNLIEDVYGCESTSTTPCTPGTSVPWDQVQDVIHIAAITRQGTGGEHWFLRNTIRRVPAGWFLKHDDGNAYIEDNILESAQRTFSKCAATPVMSGNTYTSVTPSPDCPQ